MSVLQPNTSGHVSGFEPQPNEIGFTKRRFDDSYNSELLTLLDSHEVKRAAIARALMTGVIVSTMRSLGDRDYVIDILRDTALDSVGASFIWIRIFNWTWCFGLGE